MLHLTFPSPKTSKFKPRSQCVSEGSRDEKRKWPFVSVQYFSENYNKYEGQGSRIGARGKAYKSCLECRLAP